MEPSWPGGATGTQTCARSKVRMKQENDGDSNATHSHKVNVKYSARDQEELTITCKQPRTVLELVQSSDKYNQKWSDENIVIQVGSADTERIIATHFPCTCIDDNELLTISYKKQKVEEARGQNEKPRILSRDEYSVFYIGTVGGLHTKKKKLFKNNAVKDFTYLCVYGEKGMTVKDALERDGRFIDDLGDFTLSHNEKSGRVTESKNVVDELNEKKFKLRLPLKRGAYETVDIREINEKLREQFPDLKKWMESRFPDSYQEALNLKSKDFGKIQQSFSEVHRVRKLLKLGESVCKVIVDGYTGTGFVLFDNYILTNAHLFKDCTEGQKVKQGVKLSVLFNYEEPEPSTNYNVFQVVDSYICLIEGKHDYAVLILNPEGKNSQTQERKEIKDISGLLKKVGPIPRNGEACIIGHPGGEVKQMDLTCIIEKENMGKAEDENLHPYRDTLFTIQSIHHLLKKSGIDQIMTGGNMADKVVTCNTYMYDGSSGSPVFDARGNVFGLHTGGFVYGFPKEGSAIELAQPLLIIFKHFVEVLKGSTDENLLKLLKRVVEEAKGNSDLEKILEAVGIKEEPADAQ